MSVSVFTVIVLASAPAADEVSFSRDVRPLLAARCFACHGPDDEAREADLRLDSHSSATADRGGYRAIAPGDAAASELLRRIASDDPDERMPPADSGKPLTKSEIDTLRRWIAAGALFEKHWAFVPPKRGPLPKVNDAHWPQNAIDRYVLARLESEGLTPSPEADAYTLIRRLYLDLIGIPPAPEEADYWHRRLTADENAATDSPNSGKHGYEELVNHLLASPRYGEHWGRRWLDLARYADTNGYEKDRPRSIWPYRDWVVAALNEDMPYSLFTIEQLAGDMLKDEEADVSNTNIHFSSFRLHPLSLPTGFHRNTMLNEEGGIDPLEYRFYAMVDRVATTGTVWLGLTVGCAQCHSHKYDPLTHTDYYRLMALLNNADEPEIAVNDADIAAQRREIERQIAGLEAELPQHFPPANGEGTLDERRQRNLEAKFAAWRRREREQAVEWHVLRPATLESNLPRLETLEDGAIFSSGDITKRDVFTLRFRLENAPAEVTALRLEAMPDDRLPARGPGRAYYEGRKGDFFLSEVTANIDGRPAKFSAASHSFGKISIGSGNASAENVIDDDGATGWSTASREGEPHQLVVNFAEPLPARGELTITLLFERHFAASLGRFRLSATSDKRSVKAKAMPVEIEELLSRRPVEEPPRETTGNKSPGTNRDGRLFQYFLSVTPDLVAPRKKIEELRRRLPEFPTTLVMQERPADHPRKTYRHHRGEYLSPREEVEPGLPEFLLKTKGNDPSRDDKESPRDRLELAAWLVSEENPLAARVAVNRAWRAFFGQGLVRTVGDFGTQSELPTHPELLDWLAVELMSSPHSSGEGRWSLKRLHRLIVTSATYRQSSKRKDEGGRMKDESGDSLVHHSDPYNHLLARGPRFRVEAETVRDTMLAASGLLSTKMGGPGVYPPQPASVTALAYGNTRWQISVGEDRYRRSLYTFRKRTAPFAASAVFDAPSGETCTARRDRSNTPLAALTLLNDEMFLESARELGRKASALSEASPRARAAFIFRRLLTRPPSDDELEALIAFQASQLERLQSGELEASAIASEEGASPRRAAWVMVARALMNADETITRP